MPERPIAIGRVCAKSVELGGRANEQIGQAIPIDIPGGDPRARERHAVDPHSPFAVKPIGTRAVNLQFPKAIEGISVVFMSAGDGKFDYPVSVQIRATADPTRVSGPGFEPSLIIATRTVFVHPQVASFVAGENFPVPVVVKIRDHKARAGHASVRRGIGQKIIAGLVADIANDADAALRACDNVRDAVAIHIGKLPAVQVAPFVL